ncbi:MULTISPECIES: WapI family immunity protein [Vibrio]|uniref:WapI family immunity protein n=1 Tax=Vibrio TaxID=662 RepID=UPI0005AECF71|nr:MULTISPECIES: hypothetical protein [Vibrio]KIP65160.1 hypothetical protein SN10_26120 [Vibrio harveyi]
MENIEVVHLKTHDDTQSLTLQSCKLVNRTSLKCNLTMKSRGFSYSGNVRFDNVAKFAEDIISMSKTLSGTVTLTEEYGVHFINFKINRLGHVIISGTFAEHSANSQLLEFEFVTDQTCLEAFASDLKLIVGKNS